MSNSRSPISQGRLLKKVALPEEIKTFFSQRRRFIRSLPSYEQIEGICPENHEHCFDNTYGYPRPLQETYPVNNQGEENFKKAQKFTRELLHRFFHLPQGEITEPFREYMLTGGTKPIRVSAHIHNNAKRVYVKLPSVERIMGLSFYNLISNQPPIDFVFSEYVFVEDSVPGRHIEGSNIGYFQRFPKLSESLVRLATQDRFLGLNDLDRIVNLPGKNDYWVNLLVQTDGQIVAFDVDLAFTKPIQGYNLIETARNKGLKISKDFEVNISKDEAKRITHNIKVERVKDYKNLVCLMDKIESLRSQFKEMGFRDAKAYFDERERWLRAATT